MKKIEKAIESGYQNQISSIYGVLSQSLALANDDDAKIQDAEARFSVGLDFAKNVRTRARAVAGLKLT